MEENKMADEIMANGKDTSLDLFKGDLDKGFENMGTDDMALPFIRILGQLSPQITQGDAKYIEGARAGMIYNTVTNELFDGQKGIEVIPCYYKKEFVEWRDRGDGPGAPVAVHKPDSAIIATGTREGSKIRLPNGNYLEETASYFVMVESKNGGMTPALITMKSTQLTVSKKWNSMMKSVQIEVNGKYHRPPMNGVVYRLKSNLQKNDKGSWYGWGVNQERVLGNEDKTLYLNSKKFASDIQTGDVQTKHGEEETAKSHF
tara:strand:- start:3335 stop:4114 length:780 start_codon:yes stop_codon:yes gene_type:complete